MQIQQSEADRLLLLEKVFVSQATLEFGLTQQFASSHDLISRDRREQFLLDLERGNKKRARLRFQTRAHKIVVLARLDIAGKPHRNPETCDHRPGERLTGVHIHLYREGFGDRIAFLPEDLPGFTVPGNGNGFSWLLAFLDFCRIVERPDIQAAL